MYVLQPTCRVNSDGWVAGILKQVYIAETEKRF